MADGSIVYEVRVDSGNIDSDLSRVGALLDKGTKEINRLAANTAQTFGKMLGEVFGNSAAQAENTVSRLSAGFDRLKNAAAPLLNALIPVTGELLNISKINIPVLGDAVGKLSSGVAAAAGGAQGTSSSSLSRVTAVPSFATGASYIPYDDFPALLHKGEAVLTASENTALKAAGGVGALSGTSSETVQNSSGLNSQTGGEFGGRPLEVTLKIGDYEFTQIIADTMNSLYRQWGTKPLK